MIAGVDLFAVETMMGVTECMAAVEAIRSLCDTPILCTLSVYSDGKCYFDGSAEEAAEILPGLGADAVGLNCSSGPDQIGTVVRMMKKAAPDTPIAAKPNAGLPTITETGAGAKPVSTVSSPTVSGASAEPPIAARSVIARPTHSGGSSRRKS